MDHNLISRIDRAVADNIKDIQRSFGSQAGLVQDFIVFISRQLKTDLFGYTRFSIQQFCQYTGRNRQDLAMIHPDFLSGIKQPPVIQGYAFQTVLDYALYTMMERNIIFSSIYEVKGNNTVIQMHNYPILKDLKLNFNRTDKAQKIYDVRISDELLYGFISRYYTIDADSYKLVGKGRGGDSRKKLLIYLSKLNHVLLSSSTDIETIVPLDRLCAFADITDLKPSHRRQNLLRMLLHIRDTGKFPYNFEFISYTGKHEYFVRLEFNPLFDKRRLQMEHGFYNRLLTGLKAVYDTKFLKQTYPNDEDPFQYWLSDKNQHIIEKAQVLQQAYYIAFNLNLSQPVALDLVRSGYFLKPLDK